MQIKLKDEIKVKVIVVWKSRLRSKSDESQIDGQGPNKMEIKLGFKVNVMAYIRMSKVKLL